jgi:TrkA-N domain
MEVFGILLERGCTVVVVERYESNRYLNQVRQRGVPLVLGDSTLGQALDSVNLSRAASVAIVTSDDLANIETGLAVRSTSNVDAMIVQFAHWPPHLPETRSPPHPGKQTKRPQRRCWLRRDRHRTGGWGEAVEAGITSVACSSAASTAPRRAP